MDEDTPQTNQVFSQTPEDITQQTNRERQREREQLSDLVTSLKSLLRLDQDGIGNRHILLESLESTRQAIDRFSISVRRESFLSDVFVTDRVACDSDSRANNRISSNIRVNGGVSDRISCDRVNGFRATSDDFTATSDDDRADDDDRATDSVRSPSTQSSWRSSISTAATSVSMSSRDSILYRNFLSNQDERPEEPFSYRDDDNLSFTGSSASDDEEDSHDESFERLSSILASLQKQAETAVSTPAITHPDDSVPEVAGGITPTPHFFPSAAGISSKGSPAPAHDSAEHPLPTFSPTHRRSFSPAPRSSPRGSVLGMVRRRSGMPLDRKLVEIANLERDLEGLLTEFLDERKMDEEAAGGELQDILFKWVWIYMMGGGVVWLVVGMVLGWGCGTTCEIRACE